MPKVFGTENKNQTPAAALWLTNIIVQLFVISTYWSTDAFALMLSLTSAMSLIPYLLVAAFGAQIAQRRITYDTRPEERNRDLIIAAVATAYTAFMILAGGLKFLLLSALLYAPGTILYVWARREQGRRVFATFDWVLVAIIVAGAAFGIYGLVSGTITI
jgi:arginine:ornithine antiporter/lysine permease